MRPDDRPQPTSLRDALRTYASADPRTLGLFRILFATFLLVDLWRRLADYVFFYTNEGMLPNHGSLYFPMSGFLFSLHHAASTRGEVLALFAVNAIVYLGLLVGYRTKLFQVLSLVFVTSLHSRNVMLENGGDVVCNILALWTVFLPLGRRFSIDAIRRRGAAPDREPTVSLAYAAIFVNLAVIYYFNTVQKDGVPWQSGTSVHYVLWADRLVQWSGVWLRGWVPLGAIRVLTVGTLVIEGSITLLLLSPVYIRSCRRVAALMILMLHSGFQSVGHFGMFSFIMMLHAPLLLGPEDWDALARRMRARLPRRVLFYDPAVPLARWVASAVRATDHLGRITVTSRTEAEAPAEARLADVCVVAPDGRMARDGDAVAATLRCLPYGIVGARLLSLPVVSSLARLLWPIGRRFAAFAGDLPTPSGPEVPLFPVWGVRLREASVGLFVLALGSQVLAENRKIPSFLKPSHQPELFAAIAQYPRFFQGWSMFAPVPPNDDGRIVIDATTASGRHVDPLTGGAPVDFELPDARQGMLMSQFWYELHDRMRRPVNARYQRFFHDWILAWPRIEGRPAGDRIVAYEVHWVWRATNPPGTRARLETHRDRFMSWSSAAQPGPSGAPPFLISTPTSPH